MKTWKSKEKRPHGVWTSEIRLRDVGIIRSGKVKKLLKLLEKEGMNEVVL